MPIEPIDTSRPAGPIGPVGPGFARNRVSPLLRREVPKTENADTVTRSMACPGRPLSLIL